MTGGRLRQLPLLAAIMALLPVLAAGQVPTAVGFVVVPQRTAFWMTSAPAPGWEGTWDLAVGATAIWKLSRAWDLRVGLDYSRFSAKGSDLASGAEVRVHSEHVQFPVMVQPSIPTGIAGVRLLLSFGPTVIVLTDCRYRSSVEEPYSGVAPDAWVACSDPSRAPPGLDVGVAFFNPRRVYLGVVTGAALQLRVSEGIWLNGGLRGEWGLEGIDQVNIPGDWRRQSLGVSLGMTLAIANR